MEFAKLIAVILGATGFWKLVEILLKLRIDKRLKKAETTNLFAQANSQIVDNWVGWSQKLEQRVKELEGYNTEMRQTIDKQRNRINELEKHVGSLEKCNKELTGKLEELKKQKHGE
jgi:uncharacterized coiled-coil protein SlyX